MLVALHGYEDDPSRLGDALDALVARNAPGRWRVVSPRSPVDGPHGPSWFGADGIATAEHVAAGLEAARGALRRALEAATPRAPTVLVGFSQGGALALALAYGAGDRTPPISGAACLGGFLLPPDDVPYDWTAPRCPALVVHGADDEVVPVQQARAASRVLERNGVPVTLAEVPTGHVIEDALLAPLADWLAAL